MPKIPTKPKQSKILIRPVLGLLGWTDFLPQQATTGHEDIPDHLLFLDTASKGSRYRNKQRQRSIPTRGCDRREQALRRAVGHT